MSESTTPSKTIKAIVVNTVAYGKEQIVYLNQGKRHGVTPIMYVAVDFSIGDQKGTRTGPVVSVFATRTKASIRTIYSSKIRYGEVRIGEEREEEVVPKSLTPPQPKPPKDTVAEPDDADYEDEGDHEEEDPRQARWDALEDRFERSITTREDRIVVNATAINSVAEDMAKFAGRIQPKDIDDEFADEIIKRLDHYANDCKMRAHSTPAVKPAEERLRKASRELGKRLTKDYKH